MIGAFTVDSIDEHKRGVGAASLTNFQYHLKLEGYPTQMGIWRHVNTIPQCREIILPTVLLYCRQTLQHVNPLRENPILSPRMSHNSFTGLFLYCLVLFLTLFFGHIRLSNH